jgi:hypothetical protein
MAARSTAIAALYDAAATVTLCKYVPVPLWATIGYDWGQVAS